MRKTDPEIGDFMNGEATKMCRPEDYGPIMLIYRSEGCTYILAQGNFVEDVLQKELRPENFPEHLRKILWRTNHER